MGNPFRVISQLRNLTNRWVWFEVSPDDYCPVPDLPPAKTRQLKLSRILQCSPESGSDWKIRVLVDDQFTGIEINRLILLYCTRITFRYGDGSDSGMLFVEGVLENFSDNWLRLKYFGFMRNRFWDGRQSFQIASWSDPKVATKLSPSIHTQCSSPIRKVHNHEKIIRKKDSTVHPTIETQPNDVTVEAPKKPRILPVPQPQARPRPPPSKPRTRSREQYDEFVVAEDSSDEDDIADDSSSDTTDRVSPTRAGGGAGRLREENSPAWREIGGSDGGLQRSIRREQMPVSHHDPVQHMDSFEDIEAHNHGQHLASFPAGTTLLKSSSIHTQSSSPIRKAHSHEKIIRKKDSPVHPTIETQPNDVTAAAPEKPRILPVPRPPARPLPQSPPRTRSREEYSDFMVSEDSSDEDSLRDKADDSSSDTTDRVSPTRAGGGAGQRREENSPARWEISGSGGLQRSIRREQIPVSHDHDPVQYMDSFVYVFLFCIALALVWLIPKLLF